jgi:hypothetical protein
LCHLLLLNSPSIGSYTKISTQTPLHEFHAHSLVSWLQSRSKLTVYLKLISLLQSVWIVRVS